MIVDFHTHIFSPAVARERERYANQSAWFAELYQSPRARLASAEDLIEAMEGEGVDRAVICGFGWSDLSLCSEQNDYILESVSRYPDRLLGLASVQPRAGQAAVAELERCIRGGLRGVGELMPDSQGYSLGDLAVLAPVVEATISLNAFVLLHVSEPVGHLYPGKGTAFPQAVYRFVQGFPQLTVVCAHWGGGLPFYELMPEVAEAASNVYYDTAASPYLYRPQVFPAVTSIVGAHKVLFATDFPLIRPASLLKQIRAQELPEEDLKLILGGNAARLLGLLPSPGSADGSASSELGGKSG